MDIKSLGQIRHDLIQATQDISEHEDFYHRLIRTSHWVINTYDNPDNAPQTLDFQINQLREVLTPEEN